MQATMKMNLTGTAKPEGHELLEDDFLKNAYTILANSLSSSTKVRGLVLEHTTRFSYSALQKLQSDKRADALKSNHNKTVSRVFSTDSLFSSEILHLSFVGEDAPSLDELIDATARVVLFLCKKSYQYYSGMSIYS
jgi:hypothetical protein